MPTFRTTPRTEDDDEEFDLPNTVAARRRNRKQSTNTNTPTRRTGKKGYPPGYVDPVPTTPQNRKRKGDICGAKRSGKSSSGPGICCMPAGWGTPHRGTGACKLHGGNQPSHNAAAMKRILKEELAQLDDWEPVLGKPIEIDPHTAVLQEIHRTAGHIHWLHERIVELGLDPDSPEGILLDSIGENKVLHQWTALGIKPSVWIDQYNKEREHLVFVSKAAVAMGVAERQISLAEGQAKMIAAVLMAFIKDQKLSLTPEQRMIAPEIARHYLETIPAAQGAIPAQSRPKASPES